MRLKVLSMCALSLSVLTLAACGNDKQQEVKTIKTESNSTSKSASDMSGSSASTKSNDSKSSEAASSANESTETSETKDALTHALDDEAEDLATDEDMSSEREKTLSELFTSAENDLRGYIAAGKGYNINELSAKHFNAYDDHIARWGFLIEEGYKADYSKARIVKSENEGVEQFLLPLTKDNQPANIIKGFIISGQKQLQIADIMEVDND